MIGKHEVQNFEHCVWLQVAHEVAHHVQYAICPHIKRFSRRGSNSYFKPHGDGFKTIYRYLRRDFINPLIDTNESYFDHWFSREDLPKPKDNEEAKSEVKKVSSHIFKQILVLLHPFIPFVTEEIWLKNKFDNSGKNFLMLTNWPSGKINKDDNTEQVEKIINIISELRSFKNELNVSPGSFIDVSISNINDTQKKFINNNEIIIKKLGRINEIHTEDINKPAETMVVSGDLFKIYFDKDIDLKLIKENLTAKQSKLQDEMNKISQRLENKSFVDRAPKEIVEQEKTNYNNLKNDIEKISVTIKGI